MTDRITSAVLLTKTNEPLGQVRINPDAPAAIPVEKDGHCWRALIKWASGHETNFRIDRVVRKGDVVRFEAGTSH